jgi:hypothetical protein
MQPSAVRDQNDGLALKKTTVKPHGRFGLLARNPGKVNWSRRPTLRWPGSEMQWP